VAAVFVEPVQNAGGCFPPRPGYFERLREICDAYDVLLVSDEVICAYGRLGTMFGPEKYHYVPDIITSAKGLTSGYSPLGAAIISDRIFEPFSSGAPTFPHGYTFGGHPVSCAVGVANLDIFEREDLLGNVLRNENAFRQTLERLYDLPIVGNIRGDGYFYGIELVKDKTPRRPSTARVRADPARLRLRRAVRERAVLPRRRPRRPGRPGGAAADLRPGRVRRDGAGAAARAERGLDQALAHQRDEVGYHLDGCGIAAISAWMRRAVAASVESPSSATT
jgi:adenosylmethionine-8-amino-7-oxononanoate aminotransferase